MKQVSTEEFIASLADEIEELDRADIKPEYDLKQLPAWNSINSLFILVRIEQDFGVEVTIEDIRYCDSIKKLVDLISERQANLTGDET